MKKGKIVVLFILMAITISACGNKTSQEDHIDLQENDTVIVNTEGQIEDEGIVTEKETSYEDKSFIDSANSKNDIVEITDYIGNFEKFVEIMGMDYDNEAMMGSNNYYIDNFKLGWDDSGYYVVSNQGNENVALYCVCIGDSKADVLSKIQEYGYTCQHLSEYI